MWVRRLHPEDRERVLRQFRDACATGGRFASEYRVLDHQGRVVWWRDEGRVLPGPDGKARFLRGFVLDVTEQRIAEESLRRLRLYDQLTGLPNRMMLLNRLGRALRRVGPHHAAAVAPDPGARPLQGHQQHAGPPQRRHDRARPRGAARATRWATPTASRACAATSSACCCRTPTAPSRARSATASWARSRSRSWCSGCRSRSRPASGSRSRPTTRPRPRGCCGEPTRPCRRRASSAAGRVVAVLARARAARSRAARAARRAAPRAGGQRARGALPAQGRPQDAERRRRRGAAALAALEARLRVARRVRAARGDDRAHPPADALGARPRDRRCALLGARRHGSCPSRSTSPRAACTTAASSTTSRRRCSTHDLRGDRLQIEITESAVMNDTGRARPRCSRASRAAASRCRSTTSAPGYTSLGLPARAARPRAQDRQVVRDRDGRRGRARRTGPRTRRSCARRPTWPTTWA